MPNIKNQKGVIQTFPLLLIIVIIGLISFLLVTATVPFKGGFAYLFPKKDSHAAETIPPNCPDSLQSKIDAAASGQTVTLNQNCVYRETITLNKPITIDGGNVAQIRGSDVWSSWTQSGNMWISANSVPNFTAEPPEAGFIDSFQANHPEQVFFDGNELYQVPSSPGSGQFSLDSSRRIILADNPAGHTVEVTTRRRWFNTNSDNVTLTGLTLKHAGTSSYESAVSNDYHTGFVLKNSSISNAHGGMIGLGSGAQLLNNVISKAGDTAVGGYQGDGVIIRGNTFTQNGFGGWDWGWQAGAIKMVANTNLTIDANIVHDNNGPGIWCDIGCNGVTWTNNRSYNNVAAGLMFEISSNASIHDNLVWNNGLEGIFISTSINAQVYNNISAWNKWESRIGLWSRGDAPAGCCTNTYFHNNTFIHGSNTDYTLWLADDFGDFTAQGNHGDSNQYWYPFAENGACRFATPYGCFSQLSQLNGTAGGGGNSSYISDALKDSVLSSHNMPTCPTCGIPTPTPTITATPTPVGETPFNGPHSVPGILQAEDYDIGGEGVAYHDLDTTNNGGMYRTADGVDIKTSPAGETGYTVGWGQAGEWLKYTVNVTQSGSYTFSERVAALSQGGTFHIEVDGVDKTGTISIPSTGSWDTQTTISQANIDMTSGTHVIRFVFDTNGPSLGGFAGDLNYIDFTLSTPSPSPTLSCPKGSLGDINCDSAINIFDYNILVTNFGKTEPVNTHGDLDGNGKVDIFDYNILVTNFGK